MRCKSQAGRKRRIEMRQLLKNAKIYDGTGADAFTGDILLEEDRIARVA